MKPTRLTIVFLVLSVVLSLSTLAQTETIAGKVFRYKTGETCKSMSTGGCMVYTYQQFEFGTDSVVVKNEVKAMCSDSTLDSRYNASNFQVYRYKQTGREVKVVEFPTNFAMKFEENSLTLSNQKGVIMVPVWEATGK